MMSLSLGVAASAAEPNYVRTQPALWVRVERSGEVAVSAEALQSGFFSRMDPWTLIQIYRRPADPFPVQQVWEFRGAPELIIHERGSASAVTRHSESAFSPSDANLLPLSLEALVRYWVPRGPPRRARHLPGPPIGSDMPEEEVARIWQEWDALEEGVDPAVHREPPELLYVVDFPFAGRFRLPGKTFGDKVVLDFSSYERFSGLDLQSAPRRTAPLVRRPTLAKALCFRARDWWNRVSALAYRRR